MRAVHLQQVEAQHRRVMAEVRQTVMDAGLTFARRQHRGVERR